jgi:hypothetical protein
MDRLRRLLILLLCLSVPLSGWASVAGVEACAARAGTHAHSHSHGAQQLAHHHDEASEHRAASHDGGGPDKCDSSCRHGCACGCGMGACTSGFASLFDPHSLVFLFGHDARIAGPISDAPLPARGSVPLRPPIS